MNISDYRTRMTTAPALFICESREDADALGHDAVVFASGAGGADGVKCAADIILQHSIINIAIRDIDKAHAISDSIRLLDAGKRIYIPRPAAWRGAGLADRLKITADKGTAIADLMRNAEEVEAAGIVRWEDEDDEDQDDFNEPGLLTRIPDLDRMTNGLKPGIYEFVAAPGMGKSTLALQIILECVDQLKDSPIFLFSGELSVAENKNWIRQQLAGAQFVQEKVVPATGYKFWEVDSSVRRAINRWMSGKIIFYDNMTASADIERVLSIAENMIYCEGTKVVVLDNLMALESDDYNETERQMAIMKKIKAFQRATNSIVILICHAKKLGDREIDIESISGTFAIANWANYIFAIAPPIDDRAGSVYGDPVDLKALKTRQNAAGRGKRIPLSFDSRERRFYGNGQKYHRPGWAATYEEMFGRSPFDDDLVQTELPF